MVHQYQLNGYNIVLDTCSGSVHVVDDVAYDAIAMYKEHSADEIVAALLAKYGSRPDVTEADLRQCLEDVASLESAGKLWAPDVYENMAFDFKNRQTVVKALCLHVAHTCNLNCSYCFASQGRYQGDRALMSFEVGKRAMDFLIENSGTRRNLEVDFFGGEPLMNFDMVKKLVAYCREQEKIHNKNFRFTMTTNGVLIDDDVIDFCNKECHNVVLSLDGRKEVHDRFRKDYAGHGSYDAIVPKFQEFVKKRGDKNYYMRGTYTHYNTDFTNDIFHMADLGFTELSMEPVVSQAHRPQRPHRRGPAHPEGAVRDPGQGDDQARPRGPRLHLLPLHDRPHRRPLHLQAHLRLRLRHRVHGRYPVGRPLPLPPVRRRPQVPDGRHLEGRHQHRRAG